MYDTFQDKLREDNMSEHTITAYLYAVQDYFKKHTVLNKNHLLLYKAELIEHFKPKTVNLRIQALNKYLTFVGKEKLRLKSVRIQQRSYLEHVISQADYLYLIARLREEPSEQLWYFVVRCLCATGARVSELVQFKAEHVAIGYFDLYTKCGKVRRLFLPQKLRDELQIRLTEQGITSGYFLLDAQGKRITPRAIRHKLKSFAHKYGIDPHVMYPHSFRHRYAKNFLEAFNDLSLLADLMGHESLETTRIYLRRTSAEQQVIVDEVITW